MATNRNRPMTFTLRLPTTFLVCLLSFTAMSAQAMKVAVAPVINAPLVEKLPLSGTLISPKSSALATRIDGYVEKLYVDVGDRVKVGDPLVKLDDKIAKLESERFAAAREEAEVLERDAHRVAREASELIEDKHISSTEYESRQARATAATAAVYQLRAQQSIQLEELDRHLLKAPFGGIVAEKLTEAGQWVNNDTAVLRLVQMNPLFLEVRVPERFFGQISSGSVAELVAGTHGGISRKVTIDRVVPVSDPNTRTFKIRAVVDNPEWTLLPGMSVKAELALSGKQGEPVMQVPADAIVRKADGSSLVWVVRNANAGSPDANSVAQPVNVVVGRRAGNRVEISSDELQSGDSVVIRGNESLRPGQAVTTDTAG